jgi:hypothetical protein
MVNFPRGLLVIRNSSRAFVRAPALSLALLFSIALGVGSNACVYAFVQGLTHPNSPLRDSDEIVSILEQDRSPGSGRLSRREYLLIKNAPDPFDWIGAARIKGGRLSQFRVFGSGLPQGGNLGIGVLPQRQNFLVGRFCPCFISHPQVSSAQLQMGERTDRIAE